MPKYKYRPLNRKLEEIRLVSLLPGKEKGPIRIRIQHVPLILHSSNGPQEQSSIENMRQTLPYPWTVEETVDGDKIFLNTQSNDTSWRHPFSTSSLASIRTEEFQPKYDALSYTWGSPKDPEIAYIAESPCNLAESTMSFDESSDRDASTLELGQSLSMALQHLRLVDKVRVLWIDAICINQDDISERNEQVKRMTQIYKLAHRVIAWLGAEENESQCAIATLEHVGQQIEATKKGRLIRAPGAEIPDCWMNACEISYDNQKWQALHDLLQRSWFYRIWCWQEIKLSSRHTVLQCGHDQISWTVFWRAVLCLHNKENLPSIIFREQCRHIACLRMDAKAQPMSFLMDLSRSKGCADARDKVYGLLGIVAPLFSAKITADYSLPVEEVYKNAFLAHLAVTKRMELLKHCDLANRCIKGPSWVPDWSRTDFAAPTLSEQVSSGISCADFRYFAPDVLEVVGLQCTAISTVSEEASRDYDKTLRVVAAWLMDLPESDVYITGEDMLEAFALTLCMNRTRERHPTNHFLSAMEWIEMLREIVYMDSTDINHEIYSNREIANTIQKLRGRTFITTEDGHIGTAPAGVRAGDHVCIFLGCLSPMILRPDASSRFKVIGECYLHGLEDGVGILGPMPHHWRGIIRGDALGRPLHRFFNAQTWDTTLEDPRLESLPSEWERAPYERFPDDPAIFERFKNTLTGETTNSDPRLSTVALEARGVPLRKFQLI